MKTALTSAPYFFVLAALTFGCSADPGETAGPDEPGADEDNRGELSEEELNELRAETLQATTFSSLERFASAKDFDAYLKSLSDLRAAEKSVYSEEGALLGDMAMPASDSAEADPSITNNQEQGVDEGDIVKAHGDYLVVLRRGRLFTVRLEDADAPVIDPIFKTDAFAPGSTLGTWYDEMLIHDGRIIVIGYSYQLGATEVGIFQLADDGTISHDETVFLRSADYYSSRNYASRLVGDELLFYMPISLFGYSNEDGQLPALKRVDDELEPSSWLDIAEKTSIYTPVQQGTSPTLHTVVRCDLTAAELDCSATAILGPYSRSFYVSPEAVYLWISGTAAEDQPQTNAMLYRMPLDESVEPGVVAVKGSPIDQFSFKESGDFINVLAADWGAAGDAMWGAEITDGSRLALVRLGLDAFTPQVGLAEGSSYEPLPPVANTTIRNRFMGEHLVYGSGNEYNTESPVGDRVAFVKQVGSSAPASEVVLEHDVERIEVMGDAAVVMGADSVASGSGLFFSSISLGQEPAVENVYLQEAAVQGEQRSHGFFYLPSDGGGGTLGLPVRTEGTSSDALVSGSAEVLFLSVDSSYAFSPLGSLAASDSRVEDSCQYSCADWYGNARPIFWRGRVFGLLGYELVEGAITDALVNEVERANLYSESP